PARAGWKTARRVPPAAPPARPQPAPARACPSPAPREREGPDPQGREGEGLTRLVASSTPSPGSLRSPPSPAVRERGHLTLLLRVDLLQHGGLAALVLEDVEQADRRVAVVGELEGAGDADIVDLLAGAHRLQRVGQRIQRELRRARRRDAADMAGDRAGVVRLWRPRR